MNLNIYGLITWARALAKHSSLHIEFYDEGAENPVPCTDGKRLLLEFPRINWGKKEIAKWMYAVYHEIGHNVPECRDIFDLLEEHEIDCAGSFFGFVINCLDDFRQEHFKYDEYLEKVRVSIEGRLAMFENKEEFLRTLKAKKPEMLELGKEMAMRESMWIPDAEHRLTWQPGCVHIADDLRKILPEDVCNEYGDAMSTPYFRDKWLGMTTAQDVYELARELIRDVFKLDPDEEEKKSQESRKAKEGKGGDEKSSEQIRKELSEKLEKGEPIADEEMMKAADMDVHLPTPEKYAMTRVTGSGSSGHWTGYDKWEPLDPKDFHIYEEKDILALDNWQHREIKFIPTKLGKQMKRLLAIETKSKHLRGQKRGKLHNKNVYRVTLKNAKGYNERIFRTKETQYDLDVAVSVLVDCSGSMARGKFECAANSAMSFIESLNSIDVPLKVTGFTDTDELMLFNFKHFDKKPNVEKLKQMFRNVSSNLHNNDDPDAVYYVYNELKKRKEKRKVLITLSDGSPASGINDGDLGAGLKNLVEAITKEGIVEVYGIGMLYDGVSRWYPQSETIDDITKLEDAMLKLIHRKIIKPK